MRAALFAVVLLACAGCAQVQQAVAPPPDPATQMPALEQRIAVLIEEARQRIDPKARALAIDSELTQIARERASDMAAKNYFAHTSPTGETSASLLMAQDAKYQGLLGENMAAQHFTKAGGVDVDAFARSFVDTWLNSPPHRENLTFADYNLTGVGAAVNADTVYVTELFSTDLGLPPRNDDAPQSRITPLASPQAAKAVPPDDRPRGPAVPATP